MGAVQHHVRHRWRALVELAAGGPARAEVRGPVDAPPGTDEAGRDAAGMGSAEAIYSK